MASAAAASVAGAAVFVTAAATVTAEARIAVDGTAPADVVGMVAIAGSIAKVTVDRNGTEAFFAVTQSIPIALLSHALTLFT